MFNAQPTGTVISRRERERERESWAMYMSIGVWNFGEKLRYHDSHGHGYSTVYSVRVALYTKSAVLQNRNMFK